MDNELNFYKGICEEQTKKLGQLQEAFDEIKEELKEKEEETKSWFDKYMKHKEQLEEIKKFEDRYQLERIALLKKITSLNKGL